MDEPSDGPVPLVVDVDRALLATDPRWEGLVRVLFSRPRRLAGVLGSLSRSASAGRHRLWREADLDAGRLPLHQGVVDLVSELREAGRPVVLASTARRDQVEALARRVGADDVLAAGDEFALDDDETLRRLRSIAPVFDYVGGTPSDPLWEAARRKVAVEPGLLERRRLRDGAPEEAVEVIERNAADRARAWTRELRPQQWAKNALLVLPILAAHMRWTPDLALDVATGLASFSLLASAVYVLNDLSDLDDDRKHPSKRRRPLAAGEVSIPGAGVAVPGLVAGAGALALRLPAGFAWTLGAYLVLNLGYSWGLKRVVVLDVVLLAALYTVRIVAGAALAEIPLTGWFIAFSVFLFLSLALLKRIVEFTDRTGGWKEAPAGRGYRETDLRVLEVVGPASGLVSALVYCLYITGPVRELYSRPDLLWVGLPVVLFWIVRIWLLAFRGDVHEDPVVFVLKDGTSYGVLAVFLLTVYLAA